MVDRLLVEFGGEGRKEEGRREKRGKREKARSALFCARPAQKTFSQIDR